MRIYCILLLLIGTFAGVASDACASRPCQNKGRCKASGNVYVCECRVDFTGEHCEISLLGGYEEAKGAFDVDPNENKPKQSTAKTEETNDFSEYKVPVGMEHQQGPIAAFGEQGPAAAVEAVSSLNKAIYKETTISYAKSRTAQRGSSGQVSIGTTYVGCYSDTQYALMEGVGGQLRGHESLTIEMCVVLCRFHKFTYAGLKDGMDCRCRNFIGVTSKTAEKDCDSSCTGNNAQMCGGSNGVSVYTSCPLGYYGYMCQHRCRCASYQCNIDDGQCLSNGCKEGWSGVTCDTLITSEGVSLQRTAWYILAGTLVLGAVVATASFHFANIYKMGKVAWKEGVVYELKKETKQLDE